MPEDVYKLTDEEWQRAQNWFATKCKRLHSDGCPSCGEKNWFIPGIYFELRTYTAGVFQAPGSVFPFFVIACANCSHSMLFNALESGVLSDEDFREAKAKAIEQLKEQEKKVPDPIIKRYQTGPEKAGKEGSKDA